MKRLACLAVFVVLAAVSPALGSELFPFVISFDAPENITNISKQLDAPAGKHGFVRVVDGHFATDAGRIRFWGTNTCFDANFQDKDTADRMADRLARFGTNCVRLHHLDMHNIWGDNRTRMTLDPVQLDKLDYFVYALKKRGIYVNLNLHVSRSLDERDGFPPDVNRPPHDKGIDNYYRPFIDANKKYAKDLLEHVNPYTGNAYKDEPAVAMIEINNENSILCTWGAWGDLHQIQDPFLAELRKLWNEWLVEKYTGDAALRQAWKARSEPLGNELLINGNFPDGFVPPRGNGWNWETNPQSDAPITNVNSVLRMDVRRKGSVAWHPQLIGSGFSVKKDQLYTLEFRAKANRETPLAIGVRMNHEPWEGLGFDTTVSLSTEWRTFRLTLVPNQDDENARVTINDFREGFVYEIDFVSLKPGGTVGLPLADNSDRESSLVAGTVPVIWKKDAGQYPKEAVDDFIDFLFDVEAKYWDEMYRFLKEEIKVKQLVSGTQVEYGSIHAQAKMDYIDYHAYWNHPVFPRRQWDQNDWYISNRALVNHLDREILGPMATKRVYG
ncbi:MAG: carbohydrate binding domain-containing protein, partial [Planctomycetaceae bacterium]|nr:carbohydrate binding domain-containing protein [Planctomycetaceae bacterium]